MRFIPLIVAFGLFGSSGLAGAGDIDFHKAAAAANAAAAKPAPKRATAPAPAKKKKPARADSLAAQRSRATSAPIATVASTAPSVVVVVPRRAERAPEPAAPRTPAPAPNPAAAAVVAAPVTPHAPDAPASVTAAAPTPAPPPAPKPAAPELVAAVVAPPPPPAPAVAASQAPVVAATPTAALSIPGLGGKGGAAAGPPAMAWTGSMRFRYEARSVLDYRVPGTLKRPSTQRLGEAGDVSLMRLRVGANVKFSPLVRGEFVVQDARVMGVEGSPSATVDNVDLYYALVDVDSLGGAPLSARIGRQILEYGDGFVISPSNWGNPGRAWDGARLRWAPKGWQVDAFTTWVMEGRVEGTDRLFSGADALWKGAKTLEVETYAFGRSYGDTSFTPEKGGAKRSLHDVTSGARARWRPGRAELRAEAAVQRGNRAGDAVRAGSWVARAAYEFPHPRKPKLAFEASWASGDADNDGTAKRWDPLFWNSHFTQGSANIFGRMNSSCLSASGSLQAGKKLNVQLDAHHFRLANARDAWYDDSGTALRRDATGAAGRDVGVEADLTTKWDPRAGVGLQVGWSHFAPGSFVRRTGGSPALDWGWVQMTVTF